MKKEIGIHFGIFLIFFLLITLLKGWFSLPFAMFWLGGFVGTILPDIDHFIYVYYLRPHELTSQRVQYMTQKRDISNSLRLLAATRSERKNLIFHTAWFQILFIVLSFWVITSSTSVFGRGVVVAFVLHLVLDQFQDLIQLGNLDSWFRQMSFGWDKEKLTLYTILMLGVVFMLGIW